MLLSLLYFIKKLMSRVRTPSGKKCHKSVLALTLFFLFLLRFFLPTTHQCCIRLYASPTLMKLENSPSFYALPYKLRMKPPALPRGMGFLSVLYTFRFLNFVVMGTFFVSLLSFFFFFCSFSLFSCVFLFVFLFSIFFFFSFLLFLFAQKLACIQQKIYFAARPESRLNVNPRGPIRLEAGQRLYISCEAVGNPTPAVEWKYPTPRLASAPRGSALFISPTGRAIVDVRSVSRADAGTYTCVARSPAGVKEERVEVIGTSDPPLLQLLKSFFLIRFPKMRFIIWPAPPILLQG